MKTKKWFYRLLYAFLFMIGSACLLPVTVTAGTPYKTWTRNYIYDLTETQSAYEPYKSITKIGDLSLLTPSDLRISKDNLLYIADTGNKRIVVSTLDGELVRTFGEDILQTPKGVFVDDLGVAYVADETAGAVHVFDKEGNLKTSYTRPTHPLFGNYAQFKPQKVVVDKRGSLYITSLGNTNGIIQISPSYGGEFLGYFGANLTRVNLLTIFRKTFFNDEQLARMADVVPITVTNLSIDSDGLIYTVSQGDDIQTLKKLNVAGKNILDPDWYDEYPGAVTTNAYGNIFVASKTGYIYEYNSEGYINFVFGGSDDGQSRVGLFNTISGIVTDDSGKIYVLDSGKNDIQVFVPTEFANLVHEAFVLFDQGKYIESKEPWEKVISMNSLYSYANIGYGEALYREENYTEALQAFRIGGNWRGYSDSFWEIRSQWLHNNMSFILIAPFTAAVLYIIIKSLDKRRAVLQPIRNAKKAVAQVKPVAQFLFIFHELRNPYDASYGIRFEKKASLASAGVIGLLLYILFVWEKYFCGFLFKTVADGYFDLVGDAFLLGGLFLLLIISCYLVCTITEGEAKMKNLVIGVVYSFAPILLLKPVIIIMTYILTYNEGFFITFANVVAYGWSVILLFLSVKNLNDYSINKTVRTILVTIFTAAVITIVLFVVYILINQVFEFIIAIAGEVVYRLGS